MIEYLTLEEIVEIHDLMIEKFGGLHGIRDENLLISAIEMPKSTMFGEDLYPTIYDKAAMYLLCIVRNHPFNDANKREDFVVEVAKGGVSKDEIARFLKYGKRR